MYDLMPAPPKPGTPLESLMLLVWRMRQDIEVQKTRLIVQAIMAAMGDKETVDAMRKAWDNYLDEVFPFKRGLRENADQAAIKYLEKIAARGPLRVTPLQPLTKSRSKLRSRAKRGSD